MFVQVKLLKYKCWENNMAVKFISNVKENEYNNWYIELTDTLEEKTVICKDLEEYKKNLEEFSSDYGFDIEVVWNKSKTLSPKNIEDLNNKMFALQEEYKEEIERINSQQSN
eukprot:TRINITY_DN70060_c0_g1_i1.p2 TRINITY_DN70060_c0_g1~~TRINITY_DN70060_c0_g1_i1.p2  ORF type:complete len:112 (+),score=21.51 TRINITY_DN70060_c0_g1_i1:390-725(+)